MTDRDLNSIQQARDLLGKAHVAAAAFATADQEQVNRIVRAMGEAAESAAQRLARSAVAETGMGRYEDKVTKNLFAAVDVRDYVLPLATCGVIREDPERRIRELAVPVGPVAALIPTTNPTSTAIYKALIAVKARDPIVMSPHPRATQCVIETTELLADAALRAGAPDDLVQTMTIPTQEGTTELMQHRFTALILATGGKAMVRAAYSSGKPAYGVGPGNVPAIIERTADVSKAVADIVAGKNFDHGLLCSAENSLICDRPVEREVRAELARQKAVFVTGSERASLERTMRDPKTGGIAGDVVGLAATEIAQRAGIDVPGDTRVLIAECTATGKSEFLSREKLSPVLAFYVEDGWEACCERSIELLKFGGIGHTLVIHCRDEAIIERFFVEKPAFRILVNTMSSLGAVGGTTGLAPALTLGPGTLGGSSTSDNVTPLHLINIRRLAYETKPYTAPDAPADVVDSDSTALPPYRPTDVEEIRDAVEKFLADRRARRSR